MYFLPFQSRTRFAAFRDLPAVEEELSKWLVAGRTWEEIPLNPTLNANLVKGTPVLGIFYQKNDTFITNSIGSPQISFDGNPRSLLFIVGDYVVAGNSDSLSFSGINESYVRREISTFADEPSTTNLASVWAKLNELEAGKASLSTIALFENMLNKAKADITNLAQRNDPLSLILPAIAAEAGERRDAINNVLSQIDGLQAPIAEGVIDVTNYTTKTEFYDQISRRATRGFVEGLLATKASEADFFSHVHNQALHNPTYANVGAPSVAQHTALASRVAALESELEDLQTSTLVKSITTAGGLLATNQGNGVWRIDSSYLDMGMDKPQETTFYFGGPLQVSLNNGGGWVAWEECNIIGIRATLGQAPTGAPVVLDILNEGDSIYDSPSDRPTFLEGEDEIIAILPDDVIVHENDEITVDIVSVGLSIAGADLSIQMRYQYVN